MRIYFSGGRGIVCTPEALVPQLKPHIMLTFHDANSSGTWDRFLVYMRRVRGKEQTKGCYAESMFMDSGAYTLFNDHAIKRRDVMPRLTKHKAFRELHGETLPAKPVFRGRGDYSFFDLSSKSTAFRQYCDRYAKFMRKYQPWDVLTTNVDAIMSPQKTWEIQQYFEKEHGLFPIPVVHGLTQLGWLEKYLESGKHKMIGLGGLGHAVDIQSYVNWADAAFKLMCPASNKHKPMVRVHGFAMTAHRLMCRWPWWSVDSATWVKLSAYGWLYIPLWSHQNECWRYDVPPIQINVSHGKPGVEEAEQGLADCSRDNQSPLGKKKDKHIDNAKLAVKESVKRWLDHCQVAEGEVDGGGEMVEFGIRSHFRARSICNLHYLTGLQNSRPKWPWAMHDTTTTEHKYTFGL